LSPFAGAPGEDLLAHIRRHGGQVDLAAAEEELRERRSRKGGRAASRPGQYWGNHRAEYGQSRPTLTNDVHAVRCRRLEHTRRQRQAVFQ
jgi:hypothetical protein